MGPLAASNRPLVLYGDPAATSWPGDEVEEPSKLVIKLPALATAKGGDAAVVAGDLSWSPA